MNYKEEIVTGDVTSWRRAYQIITNNAHQQMPTVTFLEEDRTLLPGGRTMVTNNTSCGVDFSTPMRELPLINPETGEVIGIAHDIDFQIMMFSLYMRTVTDRDNYVPPVQEGDI